MVPDPSQYFDLSAVLRMAWPALKPLAIIVLAISLVRVALVLIKWTRLMRAGMPQIDRMTGREFEEKISFLLEGQGYRVQLTPYVGDWGADLVLARGGQKSIAQLKRWNRRVGMAAVQEVVAAKAKYRCENSMIITNSYFTKAAKELARVNDVELWDRNRLAHELVRSQEAPRATTTSTSALGMPETTKTDGAVSPRCARCGREMVRRKGKYGEFWGCSGFPKCRKTQPLAPAS